MSVDVAALFKQHKRTLAFAGAAAVGGLALLQARSKDSGDAPAAGVAMPHLDRASTGGGPAAAYPIAGGFAPYDSGSSDLYNALQPQIEYLQRLAEKQAEDQGGAVPVPTPEPAPAPAPAAPAPAPYVSPAAALKAGFYKMAGTPNVYRVQNGTIDYLTPKEVKAMLPKGTKVTAIGRDSTVFQNGAHWLDKHKQK